MRREGLYIADLVDNARAVRTYLDGITRERWDADQMLRDAVLYRMLLLGEIASALPDELRDRYPDVAWRQIRASAGGATSVWGTASLVAVSAWPPYPPQR
jgi:uncharacterized protein with HEPN domain